MDRDTLFDLIPAYALGALDPEERAEFEAWLATDPEARRQLAEYQALADSLVLMTLVHQIPTHLEADLRRRLAESRGQRSRGVTRSWLWRPLAAAAALVLVVAVVLVLSALPVNAPNGETPTPGIALDDPAQLFAQLTQQDNIRRIALTPSEGQDQLAGEFVSDGSRAVIQVWKLPAISDDQTFEVWLIDEDGAQSGGLVEAAPPDEPTYILVPLDKPLEEYQGFGVSIEPDGGSPEPGPTGPRVFAVSV
jgi:anti-sigma-K factor RskA